MVKYILIIMLMLTGSFCHSQNKKLADSLIVIYNSGSYDINEMELLSEIAANSTDADISLQFAEALIDRALKASNIKYLYKGYLHKGNAHQVVGSNSLALESFYNCRKYALESGDQIKLGNALLSIAGTYANMDNSVNAKHYYKQSIDLFRLIKDSTGIGSALTNLGDLYINENKLDSALIATKEASLIFSRLDFPIGKAYNLGNTGMIYAKRKNDEIAEVYLMEAIGMLEKFDDYYPICVYLTYLSDIYYRKNEWNKALDYANKSLELAEEHGLTEQISDANLKLSELYEYQGKFENANHHLKKYYIFRDSILNLATVEKMANLRTNYEVAQKQIEVDLLNQKQGNQRIIIISFVIALFLIGMLAVGLLHRIYYIRKTSHIIEGERDRSDNLLCNILPETTAKELKEIGKVEAKHFDSVSVMFTDFKAFTAHSGKLSPEELVESVDFYFSKFDEIMEKYRLEKIKTIGDAYMCAGGLPFPTDDHAKRTVEAAFEIAEFVKESKKDDPNNLTRFDIRIGINTGSVVAGVVGTKKFAYDIWGDTVNIASRMESNSEPGKINISENTYQLIKDQYCCSYRGEIPAKNKGKLKMYFVNSRKNNVRKQHAKDVILRSL